MKKALGKTIASLKASLGKITALALAAIGTSCCSTPVYYGARQAPAPRYAQPCRPQYAQHPQYRPQYPQYRAPIQAQRAPVYAQASGWVGGGQCAGGASLSWSGPWVNAYNNQAAGCYQSQPYGNYYGGNCSGGGGNYGGGYGHATYFTPLPPAPRYQYYADPSGGHDSNWRRLH